MYITPIKLELTRKIGLMGLTDLRKLAPIGDLGYENGWYSPFGDGSWMNGGMEQAIVDEAYKQGFKPKYISHGYRGTDNETYFPEIGLRYHTDSSD